MFARGNKLDRQIIVLMDNGNASNSSSNGVTLSELSRLIRVAASLNVYYRSRSTR